MSVRAGGRGFHAVGPADQVAAPPNRECVPAHQGPQSSIVGHTKLTRAAAHARPEGVIAWQGPGQPVRHSRATATTAGTPASAEAFGDGAAAFAMLCMLSDTRTTISIMTKWKFIALRASAGDGATLSS